VKNPSSYTILDIKINRRIVIFKLIAESAGISPWYVQLILNGKRKNYEKQKLVRNTIVKLYRDAIKICPI